MFLFSMFQGNCSYGRTLMRKDRQSDTLITDVCGAQQAVNSPFFKSMVQLGMSTYEVRLRKKHVRWDLPLPVGFFVYGLAKLRLLQMYHDFLNTYIPRRHFQLVTCDTDSLYFAISGETLNKVVDPAKRQAFHVAQKEWLPQVLCSQHMPEAFEVQGDYLKPPSREQACCYTVYQHAKREPGLWKLECEATAIISLNSKSYICLGDEGKVIKTSAKGVQKRINPLTFDDFNKVIDEKGEVPVINRGFRTSMDGVGMRSYTLSKRGLSYLYIKREVLDDGVSTAPLKL